MTALFNQFTALLAEGERLLYSTGSDTPQLDVELLLAHALGMERMKMLVDPPEAVPTDVPDIYRKFLARRAAGEPVFYITGQKEFHKYLFNVNPSVLIPRPETEELVEAVLKRHPADIPLAVCDIGTGSGCIAITIGIERPRWRIIASDISEKALETAAANARRLKCDNVTFRKSDLFSDLNEKFDLVVSNPPYVDNTQRGLLQVEVRKFEPAIALFAEEQGLKVIKSLVAQAAEHCNPGGEFYCEIGFDQKEQVEKLFDPAQWREVSFLKDLSGNFRIASAVFAG